MGADPAGEGHQTARAPRSRQAARQSADRTAVDPEANPEDRIWLVLSRIPRGRVTTYGTVARLAGLPRHARLVGRTLANLPDDSRLPWHRVVNAAGRISSRGGDGPSAEQRQRLEAEGVRFKGDRVDRAFLWQG